MAVDPVGSLELDHKKAPHLSRKDLILKKEAIVNQEEEEAIIIL